MNSCSVKSNIELQGQTGKVDRTPKESHRPFASTSISAVAFLIAFALKQRQNCLKYIHVRFDSIPVWAKS